MVTTCDRCGAMTAAERVIVSSLDYGLIAYGDGNTFAGLPEGWREFNDGERITDVCLGCVTDGERADELLDRVETEYECDRLFGPAPEASA
jgi:hypothetical protein